MNPVGDLGLLKMDFLGLKTLTVIRNTCEMVKRTKGIDGPVDQLPLDDATTYDLLNKAQHARRVPVGIGRHARLVPEVPDRERGTHHGARGALSARPDGPHSRLHQAPARRGEGRVRTSAARSHLRRKPTAC
jgi:hypothetical protein